MKRHIALITVIAITLTITCAGLAAAGEKAQELRVGTFDSRSVALAFWRSPEGMEILNGLHKEMAKVKEEGDEKRIAELEVEGPGLQVRLHQQVFSTGSVTDVIERIEKKLPKIAKEAGVAIIVPKWNVAWQGGAVEVVDLTDQLVRCFNPSEQILMMIGQMGDQKPVPIEELSMDPNH